jgi:hypothetical protein
MSALTQKIAPKTSLERPRLDLSGPRLTLAFERLANGAENGGGIERHVEALRAKAALFQQAFAPARPIWRRSRPCAR